MKNQTIRILKIVQKEDYFTSCIICHHKLKKAFETNQGTMGWDCFCRQIGIPYVAKQKVLPAEVYENLAVSIVDQLNHTPLQVFGQQLLKSHYKENMELEFPIRYGCKMWIRIYPKDQEGPCNEWTTLSFICHWEGIAAIVGCDTRTIQEVIKTKAFNAWFQQEQHKGAQNLLGKYLEEMTA